MAGPAPLLASVSSAMPALLEGFKLSKKAAHVGFDWPSIDGLFDKLHEEAEELRREVERIPAPGPQPVGRGVAGADGSAVPAELQGRLQDEVGDLLFTVVNLARYLKVDPESALRHTNRKFRRRFGHVERRMRDAGKEWERSRWKRWRGIGRTPKGTSNQRRYGKRRRRKSSATLTTGELISP